MELLNIQSIPEIVVARLSSVSTFKNLYKHRQVYCTSSSPNKGSISLYTFQLPQFFFCSSTRSYLANMRSTFALLAVLSYVAVIGASPLGARAPTEAVDRRQYPSPCDLFPDLCDTSGATPPADPAPAKDVRRQDPDCGVNPGLCAPSGTSPLGGSAPTSTDVDGDTPTSASTEWPYATPV